MKETRDEWMKVNHLKVERLMTSSIQSCVIIHTLRFWKSRTTTNIQHRVLKNNIFSISYILLTKKHRVILKFLYWIDRTVIYYKLNKVIILWPCENRTKTKEKKKKIRQKGVRGARRINYELIEKKTYMESILSWSSLKETGNCSSNAHTVVGFHDPLTASSNVENSWLGYVVMSLTKRC